MYSVIKFYVLDTNIIISWENKLNTFSPRRLFPQSRVMGLQLFSGKHHHEKRQLYWVCGGKTWGNVKKMWPWEPKTNKKKSFFFERQTQQGQEASDRNQ